MRRSEALKKLSEFCKDITEDNENAARWILDFVENELEMWAPCNKENICEWEEENE